MCTPQMPHGILRLGSARDQVISERQHGSSGTCKSPREQRTSHRLHLTWLTKTKKQEAGLDPGILAVATQSQSITMTVPRCNVT